MHSVTLTQTVSAPAATPQTENETPLTNGLLTDTKTSLVNGDASATNGMHLTISNFIGRNMEQILIKLKINISLRVKHRKTFAFSGINQPNVTLVKCFETYKLV